ncbi:2-oxo-4-hydroxy-4-carboxy-5-ureidoimidazoline decarboxylase [Saccharopolyspora sp. NPDC000359]|uniref:2-oxo-4-hydroxy-4-carboxy-5-ureidoimidazoline decarboxylase n=1 Tax=Saccharopolyspora sp. NPDC000359 TaxID=3154251 RepID=UPI00331DAB22
MSTTTTPDRLNGLPRAELVEQLLACLDIPRWATDIADQRPFADVDAVYRAADAAAPALTREEIDQALAQHPRIGDRVQGSDTSSKFSRNEQAGVGDDAELARALREGNEAYERRFGHVYLVCASGRSGAELLGVLHSRLDNEPETELRIVEDELRKIARLRLAKVIEG